MFNCFSKNNTFSNIELKHKKNYFIFSKYISNKATLNKEKLSSNRHFPPAIREWNNSVYNFNKNNNSYSMVRYNQLDNLLKNYFNIYNNVRIARSKRMRSLRRKFISKKTFLSKPEIKQTNDKIIISIYCLDRIRQVLTRKLFFFNRPIIYNRIRGIIYSKIWNKKNIRKLKRLKKIKYNIFYSGIKFLKELKTFRKNHNIKYKLIYRDTLFLFYKYILSIFKIGVYIPNIIKFNLLSNRKLKKIKKNIEKIPNSNMESLIWINNTTQSIEKIDKKNINPKFLYEKYIRESKRLNNFNFKLKSNFNLKLLDIINKSVNLSFFINKIMQNDQFVLKKIFNFVNIKLNRFKLIRLYNKKTYKFYRWIKRIYFNLYKYKKLLPSLKRLIDNLYNKKTELNIVNLKYFYLNSDILTQILVSKLQKKISTPMVLKKTLLNINIYKDNLIKKMNPRNNLKFLSLNQNLTLDSFLPNFNTKSYEDNTNINTDFVNEIIKKIYPNNNVYYYNNNNINYKRKSNVLENIKYKNLLGIRINIKGRLTRRNTASRSTTIVRYAGKLKDKDKFLYLNGINNVSTIILRNSVRSNTLFTSKGSNKRVGVYGVKTWIATK